jgi:signal recognition particle GTPase
MPHAHQLVYLVMTVGACHFIYRVCEQEWVYLTKRRAGEAWRCRITESDIRDPNSDRGVIVILNRLFKRRVEEQPEIQEGLAKTRRGIFADITALFDRSAIDEELYEDLEALLIQADLGVDTTMELVEALREDVRRERIADPARAREFLRDEMVKLLENATRNRKVKIYQRGVPFVTLVVGVNGTGKTTTIAKLAQLCRSSPTRRTPTPGPSSSTG